MRRRPNNNGLAAPFGMVQHFNGRKERIHIDM